MLGITALELEIEPVGLELEIKTKSETELEWEREFIAAVGARINIELRLLELDPGLTREVEVKDRARVIDKNRVRVGARGIAC